MKLFLKLGLIAAIFLSFFAGSITTVSWYGNNPSPSYLCQGGECSIEKGKAAAEDLIDGAESVRPFSEYIVDVVKYLVTFLSLIGVIIIMYSGFTILTSLGDEEKIKNAKKMIIYVFVGIILIWSAVVITDFMLKAANGSEVVTVP